MNGLVKKSKDNTYAMDINSLSAIIDRYGLKHSDLHSISNYRYNRNRSPA